MKTQTRYQIVKIIQEKEGARPVELVRALGISPQALHRHLSSLVTAGYLEARGRGPLTRYFIAGAPQLKAAQIWFSSINKPTESAEEFVCMARDVFNARLNKIHSVTGPKLTEEDLALVIAVTGEVGNNSFDHNFGNWHDVSGCWFQIEVTGNKLWLCIADRGQGIYKSLSRVDHSLRDDQAALITAFEKTLSGRAPENRGNGLKFVKNVIVESERPAGLACKSGTGMIKYGQLGQECLQELTNYPPHPIGTITLILWSLQCE